MKIVPLVIVAALALMDCGGKAHTPSRPAVANEADCNRLYAHILDIELATQVDPDHTLPPSEQDAARWELDQGYRKDGRRDKFMRYCNGRMNMKQFLCSLHAQQLDALTSCVRFYGK